MVGQKAMDFWPSAKRVIRRMAPAEIKALGGGRPGRRSSVSLMALGPKILGHATDLIFAGLVGSMLARNGLAGARRRARWWRPCGRGAGQLRRHVSSMDVVVGRGVDFGAVARGARLVLAIYVVASCSAGCRATCSTTSCSARSTAARGRRGEDPPAAAAVLRQPAARRAAQRGSPTTSTTSPDPAADDEPAAHLAAHRARRALDDVLDLAAAGARRAGHRAGVDRRHGAGS